MNKRITQSLAVAALLALAGCQPQSDAGGDGEAAATENAVATVNGQPVTQAQLDVYAARRGAGEPTALVDDLISIELLAQHAVREGIDREPKIAGELASQRNAILAQNAVQAHLEANPVTDEAIQAEYERFTAEEAGEELHARHILVPDEAKARDIIAQLEAGADFAELAAEHSQDSSAADGGDLGWFDQGMMVEPFGERAAALEPGEYTKEPVQTRFGWHVIKLEERRPSEPPALAEVRDEIVGYLQSRVIEDWVKSLRDAAEVEILLPEAAAPPAEAPAESGS